MEIQDLIHTASCCDLKECDDCPSRKRTACRERTMHELASEVKRLQRENDMMRAGFKVNCIGCDWRNPELREEVGRRRMEMADAIRDLLAVCDNPRPAVCAQKSKKWREWLNKEMRRK